MQDYVVAEGKSGSSYYRKWNSGKAECWRKIDYTDIAVTVASGNGYYAHKGTYLFPFEFTEVPYVYATVWSGLGLMWASFSEITTTGCKIYISSTSSLSDVDPTVMTYAYGFWK